MILIEIISVDSNTGNTTPGRATFVTNRFESMTPLLRPKVDAQFKFGSHFTFCLTGLAYHLQEWMTPL